MSEQIIQQPSIVEQPQVEEVLPPKKPTISLRRFLEKEGVDFGYLAQINLMPEMITRTESLCVWPVNYQVQYVSVDDQSYEIYEVPEFYESKTQSNWTKHVIDPYVKKILDQLPRGKPIINDKLYIIKEKLAKIMGEYYISIGKLDESTRLAVQIKGVKNADRKFYKIGSQQYYYDHNKVYALRHSGAHLWMRRTGYRAEIVARMGWEDVATLVSAYAKMPTSYMWQSATCYYCNPPPQEVREKSALMYFDAPSHALAYLNNGKKPRERKSDSQYLDMISQLHEHNAQLTNQNTQLMNQNESMHKKLDEIMTKMGLTNQGDVTSG